MRSAFEKFLWKSGIKGPIPSPPHREHPRGPYADLHDAPRHQPTCIKLLDQDFLIADGFSFYWMYQEIFIDGVYDIRVNNQQPSLLIAVAATVQVLSISNLASRSAKSRSLKPIPKFFPFSLQTSTTLGIPESHFSITP